MKTHFIDLRAFFNQRIVYPAKNMPAAGMQIDFDNYFMYEEDFAFNSIVSKNDAAFVFQRNEKLMDSIACDSQIITVENNICSKIHIAGLSTWGTFNEEIKLIFAGSSTTVKIGFSDWWRPFSGTGIIEDSQPNVLHSFVCKDRELFIYYVTAGLCNKGLKQIILPDNILMSIFAITLE